MELWLRPHCFRASMHRRFCADAPAMPPAFQSAGLPERKKQPELNRSDHSASILATIHLRHEYDDLDGRTCLIPQMLSAAIAAHPHGYQANFICIGGRPSDARRWGASSASSMNGATEGGADNPRVATFQADGRSSQKYLEPLRRHRQLLLVPGSPMPLWRDSIASSTPSKPKSKRLRTKT